MAATSDSRTTLYGRAELGVMFSPKSVAVVGASEKQGAFGGQILKNLALSGEIRRYAVNPRAESVFGVRSYPTLSSIGEQIDLVAICVPRAAVVDVAREALSLGITNAIIYSSGFGESGTIEGEQAQAALVDLATQGLRLLGPNCLGYINFEGAVEMQFITGYGPELRPGGIGVVAQSGALGYLLTQAQYTGSSFSYWAAPGNSVDVDALDLANFMLEDDHTRVVVVVFEGTQTGERILELGRRAAALGKPVLMHKLGQSVIGASGARSHTGVLAGSNAVYHEAFRQAGLVTVDHYDELMETATLFAKTGRATSSGLGVFSASGGAAIMAADEAEPAGIWLPPLSEPTAEKLLDILPGFGSVGNPADVTAEAVKDVQMFKDALEVFSSEKTFGIVIVTLTVAAESMTGARAVAITEYAADHVGSTPISVLWLSEWADGPGAQLLAEDPRVPVFRSLRTAMSAFGKWFEWSTFDGSAIPAHEAYEADDAARAAARFAEQRALAAADFVDGSGTVLLDESESKQIMSQLGVPTSSPVVLRIDQRDLERVIASIDFPVVAKVVSRKIAHKARVGGVKLGLTSPAEVRAAVAEFADRFDENGEPAATLIEKMVSGGQEWFIGGRRDPAFGIVLTVGLGGTDVEGRKPLMIVGQPSAEKIDVLLAEDSGSIGGELRERPEVRRSLVEIAGRLFTLFNELTSLEEMDINPLIESSAGLIAVDAAVIIAQAKVVLEPSVA